jgi:predicted transposase/invertase (TIGR01784 family)
LPDIIEIGGDGVKAQNPHDKFFKKTFGDVAVAGDFLNNYLPQSIIGIIDIETLEPQKDSFINKDLQESFSDLLFKAKINNREGYIYFLFEHKSYTSRGVAFQLLKYMVEIWDAIITKEKTYGLPVIIPLVVYHGKGGWNIKPTLGEIILGYEELPTDVQALIPDYRYLLYDLSRYTDEQIKGEVKNKIAMTIMRDMPREDIVEILEFVLRAAIHLLELEDKQTGMEYLETLVRYLLSVRADLTKDHFNELVKKIETVYPEGSEKIMTLAELFREEGMERGIEVGEAKALARTAIKFLVKKFGSLPEDLKQGIKKLDVPTLEVIIDGVSEYKDLDEVKRYLQ